MKTALFLALLTLTACNYDPVTPAVHARAGQECAARGGIESLDTASPYPFKVHCRNGEAIIFMLTGKPGL